MDTLLFYIGPLGANLFYENLLDADIASNTLSGDGLQAYKQKVKNI